MKQLELFIDTSSRQSVTVKLTGEGVHAGKTVEIGQKKAQAVLPMIEELLKETGLTLKDITQIQVNTGPGSFTGLRVGIAVANTLATLLAIPLNGKSVGTLATPRYESSKFD